MLRLLVFLAPYLILGLPTAYILARTGELLSVELVARLQSLGVPFIYETKLSDHTFHLKVAAARQQRPDVLMFGPSRVNEFRSGMFTPLSFYNAGRAAYTQRDFLTMLEQIAPYSPKVLIFSIDFFTLEPTWDTIFATRSHDDRGGIGSAEEATILRALIKEIRADPDVLRPKRDPLYGVPALGLRAGEHGSGMRIDGSFQYGGIILKRPGQEAETVARSVWRVNGGWAPFQRADRLDPGRLAELARFVATARARGIKLVGISLPYSPEVVTALDESPKHGYWREFQQASTAAWIRGLGVDYFNFTRLETFGGRADEFVDPFHPSEPACIRMILQMMKDPVFHSWLPTLDESALRQRLAQSTRLESYRNAF